MNCSKPFILSYNRLFEFLNQKGWDELQEFWSLMEEAVCGRLKYMAKTEGLVGLLKYWSETLTAEGADFEITLGTTRHGPRLFITIFNCPSIQAIEAAGEDVCPGYCGHCKFMYTKALSQVGYDFKVVKGDSKGCMITVQKISVT